MLFASGDGSVWLAVFIAFMMVGFMVEKAAKTVASNSTVQKGIFGWLFGK
jgi:hypothetical protein